MAVLRAAEENRVLARVQQAATQRERGTDAARLAQHGQAAPAQPQAEEVGEALAGMEPQVQPDAYVAGAVAGQMAGGQERPCEDGGQG